MHHAPASALELTQRRDACTNDACLSEVYHERLQQLNRVVAGGTGATDLAGTYTRWFQGKPDSNSAEIKLRPLGGGQIFATGEATCLDNQTGVARTGSFEGTAAVAGRRIHYSDGTAQGCGMTITVGGPMTGETPRTQVIDVAGRYADRLCSTTTDG